MATGTVPGWYPGRCKDCPSEDLVGARCETCRVEHNAREVTRRKARRKARQCSVCGGKAAVVDGVALATCQTHREYFATRQRQT